MKQSPAVELLRSHIEIAQSRLAFVKSMASPAGPGCGLGRPEQQAHWQNEVAVAEERLESFQQALSVLLRSLNPE